MGICFSQDASEWVPSGTTRSARFTRFVSSSLEMFNHAASAESLISTSHLLLTKRVNLAFRIVPGGDHSEASWEKQIPIFMECLGL